MKAKINTFQLLNDNFDIRNHLNISYNEDEVKDINIDYGLDEDDLLELIETYLGIIVDLDTLPEEIAVEIPDKEKVKIPSYVAEFIESEDDPISKLVEVEQNLDISPEINRFELRKSDLWCMSNRDDFYRACIDGFEVKERPLYYAKIKGHELIKSVGDSHLYYWNIDKDNDSLLISNNLNTSSYQATATLDKWNSLGVNEHNADFEEVVKTLVRLDQ